MSFCAFRIELKNIDLINGQGLKTFRGVFENDGITPRPAFYFLS